MKLAPQKKINIFKYRSGHEFLKEVLDAKKKSNQLASLRSLAKKLGVSSSALSSYLNHQSNLSAENIYKIINGLNLKGDEIEYFHLMIAVDSLKDEKLRFQALEKLKTMCQADWPESQDSIYDYFYTLEKKHEYRYIIPGRPCFRVLAVFHSAKGPVRCFTDSFFASDTKLASTAYFLESEDQSFRSYIERGFYLNKRLQLLSPHNLKLQISFDAEGFPTVNNFILGVINQQDFLIQGSLSFSAEKVTLKGKKYLRGTEPDAGEDYLLLFERETE